jgi:hypothetical protein
MPALAYTVSDFTPFTKIVSADVNSRFTDIKTLLNTTGLDDTNVQTAGLSVTKLKKGTGTAGQFVSNNGSTVVWADNPLTSQFNVIIGSAAQVTAGTATHSTFASYTQADGDRVLVLPGYATNETWTITKKLFIQGQGNTSYIQGAITFSTGASKSRLAGIRTAADITINSGITGIYVSDVWFNGTFTFTDNNSTPASNVLFGLQE